MKPDQLTVGARVALTSGAVGVATAIASDDNSAVPIRVRLPGGPDHSSRVRRDHPGQHASLLTSVCTLAEDGGARWRM
jgi:hypothetical protein